MYRTQAGSCIVLLCMLMIVITADAQTVLNIPKSQFSFQSYGATTSSGYYDFVIQFPTNVDAQIDYNCSPSYSYYQWYEWLAFPASGQPPLADPERVWNGPLTSFRREPGGYYIASPNVGVRGVQFVGAFGGKIIGNTDPSTPNPRSAVTEALFFHQRRCFDGGSEFGFYRRLSLPSSTSEQYTMWFYYSDTTNCTGLAWGHAGSMGGPLVMQSSCRDIQNFQFVSQKTEHVAVPIPYGLNSNGQWDYLYRAYLTGPTTFRIELRDPYNNTIIWSTNHQVSPFFQQFSQSMWVSPKTGHLTLVMQKSLDRDIYYNNRGDIQPSTFDYPATAARSISIVQ